MLLVLASRFDASAASLVLRWQDHQARLLTCEGLSERGWHWEPNLPSSATLAVDGETVSLGKIRGVVSLLAGVDPSELPHIIEDEREYVAGEMMAFLVAWLSWLPCRVLNRPTPLCLTGPRLHHEQWLREAARAGLKVLPSKRGVPCFAHGGVHAASSPSLSGDPMGGDGSVATVSFVAGRPVPTPGGGSVPAEIERGLRKLVSATGAGLLTASFIERDGDLLFAGAVPTVDVSQTKVAAAMLEELEARS